MRLYLNLKRRLSEKLIGFPRGDGGGWRISVIIMNRHQSDR